MKITMRLIVSLVIAIASATSLFSYLQVRRSKARQLSDIEHRTRLLAKSLEETMIPLIQKGSTSQLKSLAEKYKNRENIEGIAIFDGKGNFLTATDSFDSYLPEITRLVQKAVRRSSDASEMMSLDRKPIFVHATPFSDQDGFEGLLVGFHDTSSLRSTLFHMWQDSFFHVLVQLLIISVVTLLIIRWSVMDPLTQMAEWIKKIRSGETSEPFQHHKGDLFAPLAREVNTMARNLSSAKAAAEEEARLRQTAESLWTPERLKEHVRTKLQGRPLFVVSNREPDR